MTAEQLEALSREVVEKGDRASAASYYLQLDYLYRTGQLILVDQSAVERVMWHVEQVMGPISREACEVPGDDDYSVLRHNIAACLKAKEQADG